MGQFFFRKINKEVVCANCGKIFLAQSLNAKYCLPCRHIVGNEKARESHRRIREAEKRESNTLVSYFIDNVEPNNYHKRMKVVFEKFDLNKWKKDHPTIIDPETGDTWFDKQVKKV